MGEGSPIDSEVWNLHLIAVCQPMVCLSDRGAPPQIRRTYDVTAKLTSISKSNEEERGDLVRAQSILFLYARVCS